MSPKFIFIPAGVIPPDQYLLDTYPARFAISAVRQLKTGITAIENDRRSSDQAETNVLVGTGEKTLLSPVQAGGDFGTWVGANDSFVEQPFDQSGNGLVLNQSTAASQPQAVSGGALVTSGAKAAWDNTTGLGWKSSANLALSGASEVWIYFLGDFSTSSTSIILETSPNYNTNIGSILVYTDGTYLFCSQNQPGTNPLTYYLEPTGITLVSIRLRNNGTPAQWSEVYYNGVLQIPSSTNIEPLGTYGDYILSVLARNAASLNFDSKAQELILQTGDQSTNREAIELDMGGFYGLAQQEDGLRDTYPPLVGIDASNQFKKGFYSSNDIMNVRRSSDQAEQEFNEIEIQGTDLTDFCGVGDGFTESVTDFGSAGLTIQQSTAARQPQVVSSGSLVTSGGLPAWDFNGVNAKNFESTSNLDLSGASEVWVFCVVEATSTVADKRIFTHGNLGTTNGAFSVTNRNGAIQIVFRESDTNAIVGTSANFSIGRWVVTAKIPTTGDLAANSEIYVNGVSQVVTSEVSGNATSFTNGLMWMFNNQAAQAGFQDKAQHLSIHTGDQSANRVNIETLLNNKYNVY